MRKKENKGKEKDAEMEKSAAKRQESYCAY